MKKDWQAHRETIRQMRRIIPKAGGRGKSPVGETGDWGMIPVSYHERRRMEWEKDRKSMERELVNLRVNCEQFRLRLDDARSILARFPGSPDLVAVKMDEAERNLAETGLRLFEEQKLRLKAETLLAEEKKARDEVETWLIEEQDQSKEQKGEIEKLKSQIKNLSATNQFLAKERDSSRNLVESLRKEYDDLMTEAGRLREMLNVQEETAARQMAEITERLDDEQWGRRQAEADRLDMAARLADIHKKRDTLALRLQQLEETHERALESGMNRVTKLEEELEQKKKEIAELKISPEPAEPLVDENFSSGESDETAGEVQENLPEKDEE